MDEFIKQYGTRTPELLIRELIRTIRDGVKRHPEEMCKEAEAMAHALTVALEAYATKG